MEWPMALGMIRNRERSSNRAVAFPSTDYQLEARSAPRATCLQEPRPGPLLGWGSLHVRGPDGERTVIRLPRDRLSTRCNGLTTSGVPAEE
jgi:hypothetical protein